MKALGGCFLIDDFGRQFVSPRDLLNRWIVPMESRVDYMKLRSGASFCIPFEEIVIFATNLNPEDLMDPAFLRRLPYKIEVGSPGLEQFRRIFQMECARHKLTLSDEVINLRIRRSAEPRMERAPQTGSTSTPAEVRKPVEIVQELRGVEIKRSPGLV